MQAHRNLLPVSFLLLLAAAAILSAGLAPRAWAAPAHSGDTVTVEPLQTGAASSAAPTASLKDGGDATAAMTAAPAPAAAKTGEARTFSPRVAVWLAAQMHVWFAAFVLAVPVFVVIIEAIGALKKEDRYDRTAREFLKVSLTAYTLTALTGLVLLAFLLVFYPALMKYLNGIFGPTFYAYGALFAVENALLYLYYHGWERLTKRAHLAVGFALVAAGTLLMMVANAWLTFMMTPSGLTSAGEFAGSLWRAVDNPLWSPMNLHRFIANIAYGGSIVGMYAAYRFLWARSDEERAHYDWMGYTANLIAVLALLPLPFAGYWLVVEMYAYSQQVGITLMGGVFAWIFIIQAVLIGALFLAANYYLWCGMSRGRGGARYARFVKYIAAALVGCFTVWFTPHTLALKASEAAALGGAYHKYVGPLGLMPAKNVAVNIMILCTYLSFMLYRRCVKRPPERTAPLVNAVQAALFTAAAANIVVLGVYHGYYADTAHKVASSVPQVVTTLLAIVVSIAVEAIACRGVAAEPLQWGRTPGRAQYALILIAVTYTWLMGLMGYVRSAIRQHWHVWTVMKDPTPEAYTPSIGYAANVVSVGVVVFFAVIIVIFRLSAGGNKAAGARRGAP